MISNEKELGITRVLAAEFRKNIEDTKQRMQAIKMSSFHIKLATKPLECFLLGLEEEITKYERNHIIPESWTQGRKELL